MSFKTVVRFIQYLSLLLVLRSNNLFIPYGILFPSCTAEAWVQPFCLVTQWGVALRDGCERDPLESVVDSK